MNSFEGRSIWPRRGRCLSRSGQCAPVQCFAAVTVRITLCHAGFKALHALLMSYFIRPLPPYFQHATEIAEE
jgi:hypothetical protein